MFLNITKTTKIWLGVEGEVGDHLINKIDQKKRGLEVVSKKYLEAFKKLNVKTKGRVSEPSVQVCGL